MDKKISTILIISGLILLLSLGVIYFLAIPAYKEVGAQDVQIQQLKDKIDDRNNYYTTVESQVLALEAAGWSTKKERIEINFISSPFFTVKLNEFFKTLVTGSGMTLSKITSSPAVSVKTVSQTTSTSSEVQISKDTSDTQQEVVNTSYFSQLQGPVKKVSCNLSVIGTYNSFKKLLADMESQTRIITVNSISVTSAGQETGKNASNLSNFSLAVDVYSY